MNPYLLTPTAGTITPDKIVGRAKEISQLKTLLEGQSIVLDDIRRMGKTMLLKKLAYLSVENDEPNKAIYFIFQGKQSVNSLTDVLLNELRSKEKYGWLKVQMNRCHELYQKFTSTKASVKYSDVEFSFSLPEFTSKWDVAFRSCIEDLADRQAEKGEMLTLIFDELPIMLWDWISTGKERDAMAFLDLLRSIHYSMKESNRIRFIFCGSIGMEVVLAKLKNEFQYTGEPLNYTKKFRLPPMSNADANFLCECLYLGNFQCKKGMSKMAYFQKITDACNNLPYFINAVFATIQIDHDSLISSQTIEQSVKTMLIDTGSAFDVFKQLDERLTTYYPATTAKVMRSCLKALARAQTPLAESALIRELPFEEQETQTALDILWRDELLARTFDEHENRQFAFKYNLIKQWWKLNKA